MLEDIQDDGLAIGIEVGVDGVFIPSDVLLDDESGRVQDLGRVQVLHHRHLCINRPFGLFPPIGV